MTESKKLGLLTATQVVEEQRKGAILLDTRPPEHFAALHIRGAIQIGLTGPFSSWAAMLVRPSQELVVVAEDESRAEEAHIRLARVGLERVIGFFLADETQWRQEDMDLTSIPTVGCVGICQALESGEPVQLVDVRSRAEWLKGHLPGAISVPLLDLEAAARRIDPSSASLVYCREGFRATTAASILLRESSNDIRIFVDGFEGWLASGLPLEVPHEVK
jgi:rhodanese-related sulfurtransferase